MASQLVIIHMITTTLSLLWVSRTPVIATSLVIDGCEQQCGTVTIPYPFGINSTSCYHDESYSIECRSTSDSVKPFLKIFDLEVLSISLSDSYVEVNSPVMYWNCPNTASGNRGLDLRRSRFVLSETVNRFMAVGCNNLVFMVDPQNKRIGGCMSSCDPNREQDNQCYGIDCCQTTIPVKLQTFNASFSSIDQSNHQQHGVQGCTYAFLVHQAWFMDNKIDPFAIKDMTHVPAVIDWGLWYNSTPGSNFSRGVYCGESLNNNSFINWTSSGNSGCRCHCIPGYVGNPYLPNGCQEIRWNNPDRCRCRRGTEDRTKDRAKIAKMAIIGVCSGIGGLLFLFGVWWLYQLMKKRTNMKRKKNFFKRNGGLLLQQQLSSFDGSAEKTKLFNSEELEKATDHYNEDRILGQGGQGTVYKGMLPDGRIVAVKKSKIVGEENVVPFINEVIILSQIVHRNVVKLLGCCLETEFPLLVYEFISNGTLLQHLRDPNKDFPLSWEMRLRIATEVAGALSYLHNAASVPIYHRDIKSTNILLDEKYKAKVSDFGTSRSIAIDQTHLTTVVQGTFGYLDPEYFQSSQFTDKSDVYSFGVVIVELLTGEKAISSTRSAQEGKSLVSYFIQSMEENHLEDILDPRILNEGRREEMVVVAQLAKRCLNLNGKKRPTMKEVVVELEGIKILSQRGGGQTTSQQNYEEVKYNANDLTEAWDAASTSTGTNFDSNTASSFDVQPLLLIKP